MARRLPITDRLLQQRCGSLLHCALSTSLSAMIILLSLVQLDLQPWKTFLAQLCARMVQVSRLAHEAGAACGGGKKSLVESVAAAKGSKETRVAEALEVQGSMGRLVIVISTRSGCLSLIALSSSVVSIHRAPSQDSQWVSLSTASCNDMR